jgi:hypothetical protein
MRTAANNRATPERGERMGWVSGGDAGREVSMSEHEWREGQTAYWYDFSKQQVLCAEVVEADGGQWLELSNGDTSYDDGDTMRYPTPATPERMRADDMRVRAAKMERQARQLREHAASIEACVDRLYGAAQ